MKVLLVAPHPMSVVLFTEQLAHLLSMRGHSVYTLGPTEGYEDEIEKIRSSHYQVPLTLSFQPWYDAIHILRVRSIVRKLQPDVVVTFTTKPNLFSIFYLFGISSASLILAVRGLGRVFDQNSNAFLRLTANLLYKLASMRASFTWFTSVSDREHLAQEALINVSKTILTSNAIDLSHFNPDLIPQSLSHQARTTLGISEEDFVVLMIARLVESKGVLDYISSARHLSLDHPRIKFILVAPVDHSTSNSIDPSYVQAQAKDLDNLTWIPFLKDPRPLYSIASCIALPSYYREGGYPRVLLEGMAFKKPLIACDTPYCRTPATFQNGILVPPCSPDDLSNAILTLYNDPAMAQTLGQNSLKAVTSHYSVKTVLMPILSLIESISVSSYSA